MGQVPRKAVYNRYQKKLYCGLRVNHLASICKTFLSGSLVFSYLIFGGVESPEELAEARRTDPVVAANFADFGIHTTITHLKEDMFVYVAYRIGDKVYYTKKKHKVCKGEEVITDGKNYARTRCANRMTKMFKAPNIVFNEPKPPELDLIEPPEPSLEIPPDPLLRTTYFPVLPSPYTPIVPSQTGANTGVKPITSPTGASSEVILPQIPPVSGIAPALLLPPRSSSTPPGTPVTPVTPTPPVTLTPEPGAFGALVIGGSALVWLRRRQKRRL
jgi:hypothetical protein